MSRPQLGLVTVVVLLAGGTALASNTAAPAVPRPAASAAVDVVGATAVCPDLRQTKGILTTRISVGAALGASRRDAVGGSISSLRATSTGTPIAVPVTRPGEVAVDLATDVDRDGLVVSGRGPLAAGLEVEQVTRGERGGDRGLAGLRCEAPRTDAWFEGSSTVVGDRALLVLANVDDTPALVDVQIWSAAGPVDPRSGQGITVAPHTRTLVHLEELAPDRILLAVHVSTRRGRIAPALRHARYDGRVARGVDWVPEAQPPATRLVVPGIPAGPGGRTVLITNPGTDDTTVSIRATTRHGQFVPTGLDAVLVPAGTTVGKQLTTLTSDTAVAVTITSDGGPVLAGAVVLDGQTGPVRELSYTAASLPLSGPALLTDVVLDRPTESTLILSALDADASVVVTPVRLLGRPGALPPARTVRVPAGRTTTLRLSTFFRPGTTARLAVEVRPGIGSGQVYAARYLRERGATGPLTTLIDLQGPALQVARPTVVRDPAVGATG